MCAAVRGYDGRAWIVQLQAKWFPHTLCSGWRPVEINARDEGDNTGSVISNATHVL